VERFLTFSPPFRPFPMSTIIIGVVLAFAIPLLSEPFLRISFAALSLPSFGSAHGGKTPATSMVTPGPLQISPYGVLLKDVYLSSFVILVVTS